MTVKIKTLTVKNFLSVGAVTQSIDFDKPDLTLILGENLDMGGDGARNGTGKTTALQAVAYALFGQPINNIRKDNLVNRTNGKAMLVTLDFEVNGQEYKIMRGRKPNVLKFYINNQEQVITDEAQGDSRETQIAIEHILRMTPDMFKHIVALNTYSEPFLALRANDQRQIIEQLLGITILSEKADGIKAKSKETKDAIQEEEYRIKGIEAANQSISEQIDSLKRRHKLWLAKQAEDIAKLQTEYDSLSHLDIEKELASHIQLSEFLQKQKDLADLNKAIVRCESDIDRERKQQLKHEKDITALLDHKCHTCGQDLHDAAHTKQLEEKQNLLAECLVGLNEHIALLDELNKTKEELGPLGTQPKTFYDKESDAVTHQNTVNNLLAKIEARKNDEDPYTEQISDMESRALQVISFDEINRLTRQLQHQDYLLDLLTNKKSFVRKRIIEQNLSYLNARLTHYLDKIGLPHQVVFQNDLSVEITELGRELDFDNLSRGERNRLILGLSFAFRDVWESLYAPINITFIDELIDNGLDTQGVENSIAILKDMCRRRSKSIWLVSHRDELSSRVNSILKVVKEGGFTSYSTSTELQ